MRVPTPSECSTIDLAIVRVYCYVQSRPVPHGGDTRNREVWTWVMKHLQLLPSSTTVLIMTDANGHVGTTRYYSPTDAPPIGEDARHPALYVDSQNKPTFWRLIPGGGPGRVLRTTAMVEGPDQITS